MFRILDEMERDGVRATFFILGWVASRHPELVRRIHDAGHEVASHGTGHRTVYDLTADQFRQDVTEAKQILEDIIGEPVIGYRAPSYSITRRSWWALEILAETGYRYDSSIFPIRHYRYGIPGYERFPHRIDLGNGAGIWEFPLTTVSLLGFNFPIAGGAYLRFLPAWLVRSGLRWVNQTGRKAGGDLFSSLGDRRRPAAAEGELADTDKPLLQSVPHAGQTAEDLAQRPLPATAGDSGTVIRTGVNGRGRTWTRRGEAERWLKTCG